MENIVLNTKEVASYLSCSVASIRRFVKNKKLPFFKVGSKLYFNLTDVEKWSVENGKR